VASGPYAVIWHWLVAAELDEQTGGWSARHVAGGGGRFGQHDLWRSREPRINLAAGWNADGYYGGGAIHPAGFGVTRVRLMFPNGVRLEDDAVGGLALFLTQQEVEMPVTVDFLGATGRTLGRREEHRCHGERNARAGPELPSADLHD
jgi:hypothetical protein